MNYMCRTTLVLKTTTNIMMNSSIQESIKLLQFSYHELEHYIAQKLDTNPFLLNQEDSSEEGLVDSENDDEILEDDNQFIEINEDTSDYNKNCAQDKNIDYAAFTAYLETFHEFIIRQIYASFTDHKTRVIALKLVEYIDNDGYIDCDFSRLSNEIKYSIDDIENTLSLLQTFEPIGIFARNLAECLAIQLKYSKPLDVPMQKLLENLALIANKEFTKLANICGVELIELKNMVEVLKTLNPKPANIYNDNQVYHIKPDVFLKVDINGKFILELNNDILPRIITNYDYYTKIKNKIKNNEQQYLSEHLKDANILVRALEQRAKTILRVSKAIVEYQKEFFEKGVIALKPLTLKTIAEALGLHESTISRATANKYIATPIGTFELKHFFSSYVHKVDNDTLSSLAIKSLIKELLERESTTRTLSDQQIASSLKEHNIKIARRTVTKYRESLNILSSSKRKFTKMVG